MLATTVLEARRSVGLLHGGRRVTAYRLYCLSQITGCMRPAEWIEAGSDEEAIAEARSRKKTEKCELWQGQRMVATLDPE
jgi:hypothetical protein